jgi:hypothetical protein
LANSHTPSSTLKTLNVLDGFNCNPYNYVESTPESLSSNQRPRKSIVAILKAIPSLGSLGTGWVYEEFPHFPEIQILLEFNRVTRGKVASVPPCLWVQVLRKVDKILLVGLSQQNENKRLRCKASVLFCLLRTSPEVVLALRDKDAGNVGLACEKQRKS